MKNKFLTSFCLLCICCGAMASGEIKQVPFTDVQVASESLCHNDPGHFMMRCYPIPEEATSGKKSVRIHLFCIIGGRKVVTR